MAKTLRRNGFSPPGAKEIFALSGPNYVGKSTFMQRWARERHNELTRAAATDCRGRPVFNPTEDTEVDLCPVVWALIGSKATPKGVNQRILESFGLPGDDEVGVLTTRAVNAVRRHRTQIVIFDDVHLLYTDWKGGRFVLDHIKNINTELGYTNATVMLVGANIENSSLIEDPQIAGRLTVSTLYPYGVSTFNDRRDWQRVVRQLEERVLPHLSAGVSGMLFTELAGELWLRTQGFVGDLKTLVGEALIAAIEDETGRIVLEHLNGVELTKRAEDARRDVARPRQKNVRTKHEVANKASSATDDDAGFSQEMS